MLAGIRSAAKTVLGAEIIAHLRRLKIRNLANAEEYRKHVTGCTALEIGGPSEIFSFGPLPIYRALKSIDNCNYASATLWRGAGFGPRYGRTYIREATLLQGVADESYDCVLSSHSLEHIANPLKALREWRRVLNKEGMLLLILPNKDYTFDWRRSVTTLEHLIADYDEDIDESDLTHLDEIRQLHDLSKDPEAGTYEAFNKRSLNNLANRGLHHHVFSLDSAKRLLMHADFCPVLFDFALPNNIIILARKSVPF